MDLNKELRLVEIADNYWKAKLNKDEKAAEYWKDLMNKEVNEDSKEE